MMTRKTLRLNHIGIAVDPLSVMKNLFEELGLPIRSVESVPDQGIQAHFIPLPQTTSTLELLEPIDPQGVIAKFLSKHGPGIHHLSFEAEAGTLDDLCKRLRARGYRLIYDQPRAGAHQMRINFIHPASAGGLLIELMEPMEETHR